MTFIARILEPVMELCAIIGYARAANDLALQGKYEQAKMLMLEKTRIQERKKLRSMAKIRLARVHKAKASYEPGDHYMRGKSVAFWRGKAKA